MKRRQYLGGVAGLGALSAFGAGPAGAEPNSYRRLAVGDDTHHPGPPRFTEVGVPFYDYHTNNFQDKHADGKDRDNFSPQIVGDPDEDAENYTGDDFTWSISEQPDDSQAQLEYAPDHEGVPQYDSGAHNVVEFAPDVPGTYVLTLDVNNGDAYDQTIYAFPEERGDGGQPRIELDGEYDAEAGEFVVDSNPQLAPSSTQGTGDLFVEWLADDRDALATEDIEVGEGTDSWTARIPVDALNGEVCRLHAAPSDGADHGTTDTVELDPQNEEVIYPNRPPEWIEEGIMYEIFPRSFEGEPEPGEWPLTNSNANFANMEERLDYLDSLNVDVLWFTPICPAESSNWKPQNVDAWAGGGGNRFKYVGGGPHGYDAHSYFEIAEDLGSEIGFEEYRGEPWAWEEGYDPENNLREDARRNAMAEFQSFMEAAHERDIKICLDFVINHGGRHHPFFQDTVGSTGDVPTDFSYPRITEYNRDSKYFDWFARRGDALPDNDGGVADPAPAVTGFAGLRVQPQWNFANVALREHLLAAAAYWADMGVDAFRCDVAYGIPHSFWKEMREVVRSRNSEFMLLDETIPNDPSYAENEFDMHFDTSDFMGTAHAVAGGDQNAMALYDAVDKRADEGFPDYTLIANATENHDEFRLLGEALDGDREDPEKAARALWAAGVTLPGVPFIYYGQERQISNFGTARLDYDGSGEDFRQGYGDVGLDSGPGDPNMSRAFMNWDETPEEHLQFFRDLTAFYKESPRLKPGAELRRAYFDSDSDVLVFGRVPEDDDANPLIVAINVDPGTAQIDLLPAEGDIDGTTDLVSGEDVGVDTEGEARTIEVETIAVVETDSLFSVGARIAQFQEGTGDDNGPGTYTYPTGENYADGAFDVAEASVHTLGSNYQLRFALDGPLENPDGNETGVSVQHVQVYMSNPDAEDGATAGRAGTNIDLAAPYQFRVVGHPEEGVIVEDAQGNQVATGDLKANPIEDTVVVEFPKSALGVGIRSLNLAPLLLGYDADAEGGVMQVESEAGESVFGVGEGSNPGNAPNVIDAIVPTSTTQADALSYSADARASVPFTPLTTQFNTVAEFSDPAGDNLGPGSYEMPTSGDFYENVFDLRAFTIAESRSRTQFNFTMENLENPYGLGGGWSQEYFQVYIRDPEYDPENVTGEVIPSGTAARTGVNAEFQSAYQYRVVVHGEGTAQVENAAGDVRTSDVNVSVDGDTVSFDVPSDAIGGSVEGKELAPLVAPFDGFGEGAVRAIGGSAAEYTIGASNPGNAPRVMDMIVPSGTSQSEALSYGADSTAAIPFTPFEQGISSDAVASIVDQEGDDYGPGTYTYPTNDEFKEGVYDLTQVDIVDKTSAWRFDVTIGGPLENPYDYDAGFSTQLLQIYVRDPDAGSDTPSATAGREGSLLNLARPYHYRVHVAGNGQVVEDAAGNAVVEGLETAVDRENSTISVSVPKSAVGGDITDKQLAIMLFSHDGFGTGGIRTNFLPESDQYAFGLNGAGITNAPRAIDLAVPGSLVDQTEALSYSEDSKAAVPLFSVSELDGGTRAPDDLSDQGGSDDGGSDDGSDGETTTPEPTTAEPTTTESGGMTTAEETTAPGSGTTAGSDGSTNSGDGPGFGVVSGVLGTAGGAVYAARRLLGDDPEEIESEVLDGAAVEADASVSDDTDSVESDD